MRVVALFSALALAATFSGEAAAGRTKTATSTTITYNGATYLYTGTSTCPDGSAALRYNRKWYCPQSAMTVASSTDTSTTTTTTTDTTTTGTSTTATTDTTSTGTTSTGTTTTAPSSYNAQLSWTIPTTRADGSALTAADLAGYEIYYTNDTGTIATTVPVSGGTTNTTTLASLASGNYSFAISAIDASGLKSSLSTVVTVTFQ